MRPRRHVDLYSPMHNANIMQARNHCHHVSALLRPLLTSRNSIKRQQALILPIATGGERCASPLHSRLSKEPASSRDHLLSHFYLFVRWACSNLDSDPSTDNRVSVRVVDGKSIRRYNGAKLSCLLRGLEDNARDVARGITALTCSCAGGIKTECTSTSSALFVHACHGHSKGRVCSCGVTRAHNVSSAERACFINELATPSATALVLGVRSDGYGNKQALRLYLSRRYLSLMMKFILAVHSSGGTSPPPLLHSSPAPWGRFHPPS